MPGKRIDKKVMLRAALGLVLAAGSVTGVAAEVLLLDSAIAPVTFIDGRCDGAISLRMGAITTTPITRLEAQLDITTATSVRFAIWTHPAHALVFYSTPVAVSPGLQFVSSPIFAFNMVAGQDYDVAAMVNGCANFPWDFTTENTGVLQTYSNNGNPVNFNTPSGPNDCCSVDPRIRFYKESVTPPATPAMSPWAISGLVLLALGSMAVIARRRGLTT